MWAAAEGDYVLRGWKAGDPAAPSWTGKERASPESDLTLHFAPRGLERGAEYGFALGREGETGSGVGRLRTLPEELAPTARLAFGSCVDRRRYPRQTVWGRMRERGAEGRVVVPRRLALHRRHRPPGPARALPRLPRPARPRRPPADEAAPRRLGRPRLRRERPLRGRGGEGGRAPRLPRVPRPRRLRGGGTWGLQPLPPRPGRGLPPRRPLVRRLRALAVRPGEGDPPRRRAVALARGGLRASSAHFKVIASGMLWNEAVPEGKAEHWGTWAHEREASSASPGGSGSGGWCWSAGTRTGCG